MKLQIPSLRPSAAWVTDLTDKYQNDPFFRVNIQIALLQILLVVFLAILLGGTYTYYEQSANLVTLHQIESGQTAQIISTLHQRRLVLFILLFLIFFSLTLLFNILISRAALGPSRATLSFQKRFIGNIAHEIRTPLAIIKTSTEVALFDPNLPKDVRETFEETITELTRISETINNLLSFDSLTRPKTMKFEAVDLGEVARTVCRRHQDLAESRGIALSAEAIKGALVRGNEIALDQVITNLTKNAINYTPHHKNGSVTIEVDRAQNGGVSVSVIDTGIGIAQRDLYHVFEPFYRADTSRARGIGTGTSGLGLAIVNEIVHLHHGTITLRSAEGHGTTVKITFPPYRDTRQTQPLLSASGSPHEATLDFSARDVQART